MTARFALCLCLAAVASFAADAGMGGGPDSHSKTLHQQMMSSAEKMKSMTMTGDFDHDFMMSMRDHHKDGVEMAKLALKQAKDKKARDFAQKVVDQQTKEMKELDAWLAQHSAGGTGHAGH
jgi:uncharacterized protein (DUF305 family)